MISFKSAARGACLLATLALSVSSAEAGKYKHYGSSGSSGGHDSNGSSGSHGSKGSSGSHGSKGSSSSHGSSGSSSSHGSKGSSGSHGSSGSSSSHGSKGSSGSHGSSGSSSSHGKVTISAPAAVTATTRPATLVVNVPADAVVYLMDQKMTLTGTERRYSIPLRQADADYNYQIRVEVVRDGRTLVSRSEQTVRAGQQIQVSVTEVAGESELVAVASR
jgi:uncharacterized protein (TIGR03000 family)